MSTVAEATIALCDATLDAIGFRFDEAKKRAYYYDVYGVKRWILGSGGQSGNCEHCTENAEAGWIDQDDVFPGDSQFGAVDEPPAHNHCDCTVEYGEKRKRVYV